MTREFTDAELDAIVCPEGEGDFMFLVHGKGSTVWCTGCNHIYEADAATLEVLDDLNSSLPEKEQQFWQDLMAEVVA